MNNPDGKRLVTRVWLMAELNARLKRAGKEAPDCCGCRVKQLSPAPAGPSNWSAELFDVRCEGRCLDQVTEIVGQMQQYCDVAW